MPAQTLPRSRLLYRESGQAKKALEKIGAVTQRQQRKPRLGEAGLSGRGEA
jgi:hypothetical protein